MGVRVRVGVRVGLGEDSAGVRVISALGLKAEPIWGTIIAAIFTYQGTLRGRVWALSGE